MNSRFRATRRLVALGVMAVLACLAIWQIPGWAGGTHESDKVAITADLDAQQAAWNRGDVDAFMQGYWNSPDLSFSGTSGITKGWAAVLAHYKEKYADRAAMGQLDFSGLEFKFLGPDAALVLGHWHLKRDQGDVGGVFSLVWQRFPEGWRIVHDHTSPAP